MRIKLLTVLSLLQLSFGPLVAAPLEKPREIKTEQRTYRSKSGEVIKYEIGTLFVPENRTDPKSRLIGVGFARFPAAVQPSPSPPVFRLPGGPGSSYLTRIESAGERRIAEAFAELADFRRFCDVVYLDQRGFSTRGDVLQAPRQLPSWGLARPRTMDDSVSAYKEFSRKAVAKFAETDIDLRGYSVIECAHDVADLRRALGYRQITLHGTSFGSQWSFAVMRLHPEIVARALLSGVEPLNHGFDMPSYVFAAVQRMWRVVDEDARFKPYLPKGGVAEAARVVIERLEREPVTLEFANRATGEKRKVGMLGPVNFPWNNPTLILELYHGRTERWRQAAALRILVRNRRVNLIGPLIDSSLGVTPERRYRLWTDPATRYLGRGNFARYLATADIWPSPDVGDELRTPVLSTIPVIFAQGDWDMQTPIENTFEIAPFFTNSRVIVAHRGGHGVLGSIARQQSKVWTELLEFLRTGDMNAIPVRIKLRPSQRFSPPRFSLRERNKTESDNKKR